MTSLVIIRQKYNAAGGAERFVSRILEVLKGVENLNLTLIARQWQKMDHVHLHLITPFYWGKTWRDWAFARQARAFWRKKKFDLVQSHERIVGCDIYRAGDGVHAQWLELYRRTLPWYARWASTLSPYHYYVCRTERQLFGDPHLKLVICNARFIKEDIQRRFKLPEDKLVVIYNGVDPQAFHPAHRQKWRAVHRQQWGIPPEAPLLLLVGSGFKRKGVERALAAMAAHLDVHLLIVGDDKHRERYQGLAEQLGLARRAHFSGAQQDVKPFYAMADAFILPTLYDPFPNACIEALACGLPLLTSSHCGAAELIVNGQNGWVIDRFDHSAWSHAVERWLKERPTWPALSSAARQTAEALSLEKMTTALLAQYQRLLMPKTPFSP